jgi:hypothetical protein
MISGTNFRIEDPEFVARACRGMRRGVASASEIQEMVAECEANRALCLACEDGMLVIDVRSGPESLELFVWLAVAFKHGAFARQGPALDLIGRDLGASTIAFQTRRRGWARALPPEWQRRGNYEFVRSVN